MEAIEILKMTQFNVSEGNKFLWNIYPTQGLRYLDMVSENGHDLAAMIVDKEGKVYELVVVGDEQYYRWQEEKFAKKIKSYAKKNGHDKDLVYEGTHYKNVAEDEIIKILEIQSNNKMCYEPRGDLVVEDENAGYRIHLTQVGLSKLTQIAVARKLSNVQCIANLVQESLDKNV